MTSRKALLTTMTLVLVIALLATACTPEPVAGGPRPNAGETGCSSCASQAMMDEDALAGIGVGDPDDLAPVAEAGDGDPDWKT